MNTEEIKKKIEDAKDYLSGVDIDKADNNEVSAERVEKYTDYINNNHAGDNDYVKDAK